MTRMRLRRLTSIEVSSSASDTGTVLVQGFDQYNTVMTQLVTLNGTTPISTLKAFSFIWQITPLSATLVGNLSIGSGKGIGLPVALDAGSFDNAVNSTGAGAQAADTGTLVYAFRGTSTNLTGDVQGTYTSSVTLNGVTQIWVRGFPAMGPNLKSTSTHGVAQA